MRSVLRLAHRGWRRLEGILPVPLARSVSASAQRVGRALGPAGSRPVTDGEISSLTESVLRTRHLDVDDEAFRAYAFSQIRKSLDAVRAQPLGPVVSERTERLVRLMDQALPVSRVGIDVLCVGCRHAEELLFIERVCRVGRARGLDLFSVDDRVTAGDMHAMPFPDASIDVLYACHSLEHAYDLQRALAECVRVLRPGGLMVVEMPVNFAVSATDRWDVGSAEELIRRLPAVVSDVLHLENAPGVLRMIVRISGARREKRS